MSFMHHVEVNSLAGRSCCVCVDGQPDIPHIEEHVSKVECVGLQTQQKLLDIKAAAAAVGIHNLSVVHNSITTGERTSLHVAIFSSRGLHCREAALLGSTPC